MEEIEARKIEERQTRFNEEKINYHSICAALLLMISGWCLYAFSIPARTLATQGLCEYSMRVRLIDITRHLLGAQTSAQINADRTHQYRDNGLLEPVGFGCAD